MEILRWKSSLERPACWILLVFLLVLCTLPLASIASVLPSGSFETCYENCDGCDWHCDSNNTGVWIVNPNTHWGVPAFHGSWVAWLGGWYGSELNVNSFCIEIDYLYHDVITWKWMAYVPEGHTGNVIRASIDGVTVFERELGPEDHNWGEEWRTDVTDDLDPFCGIPDQMFCIEIIPTDGSSYFVDYFEAFGLCSWVGTEESSFSAIKSYYR